jgi:hypothetical protein
MFSRHPSRAVTTLTSVLLALLACRVEGLECTSAIDLVFALDESGSVGSKNYQKALTFMKQVVARVSRVRCVRFARRASLVRAASAPR